MSVFLDVCIHLLLATITNNLTHENPQRLLLFNNKSHCIILCKAVNSLKRTKKISLCSFELFSAPTPILSLTFLFLAFLSMSHNEYTYDLYSANLVTIFNSINANDQQIDEELMQEFGSAHAAYQDVPEVVNTVHDNSSPVDLDIEDGMLIELGLHPVTTYVIVEPPFTPAPPRTPRTLVETVHATMQSPAALVSLPLLLPPPPPHAEASERFDKMQAWLKPRRAMRMLGHVCYG